MSITWKKPKSALTITIHLKFLADKTGKMFAT